METESDYLQAPPPAYSEQEFDQKISLATAISSCSSAVDDEGWEHYDPRAFEDTSNVTAAVAQPPESGSHDFSNESYIGKSGITSLPLITPLRIEKKSQSKPSNYDCVPGSAASNVEVEWMLGDVGDSSDISSANGHLRASDAIGDQYATTFNQSELYNKTSTNQDDILLDDVDFDPAVLYSLPHTRLPKNSPVNHSFQSQSSMPIYTTERDITGDHHPILLSPNSYPMSSPDVYRRSLPATPILPRHQNVHEERPVTSYQPTGASIMKFDSSVAYGNASVLSTSHTRHPFVSPAPQIQYDPHSLYNSAVSSQLNPLRGVQRQQSSKPNYNQVMQSQARIQYLRPPSQFIDTNQPFTRPHIHATSPGPNFTSNSSRIPSSTNNRYSQYPDTR
ncbi:hypothetical protein BDN70DRAFT_871351 [Pholiota conissans]|uniref:Uncharacterized protein n=1 Tax=Pholiota conissans TaxID=109636 RepID=A0A9P6CYJ4_9AGAR|nr:hypothetical protein BDN70DRAFT_871351 [Pholiota conissans]